MIHEVYLHNLRNVSQASISPSKTLNVIYGENGSGKSSFLEGVNLLSTGRSFRTTDLQSLIKFDSSEFVVRGVVQQEGSSASSKIGIRLNRKKEKLIRVNGESVRASSELARHLPLKFMSPLEAEMIEGSPGVRRKYLDWLMFHVKPSYLTELKQFKVALSNRNATLKTGDRTQEPYWRDKVVAFSNSLATQTQSTMDVFMSYLENEAHLLKAYNVGFSYYKGWRTDTDLSVLLSESIDRDFKTATTRIGYQRSDLKIRANERPASVVMSRGQMKICALALQLAQIKFLREHCNIKCVVLIDDIVAELDEKNLCAVVEGFVDSESQLFITSANDKLAGLFKNKFGNSLKLFHVEHGTMREEE